MSAPAARPRLAPDDPAGNTAGMTSSPVSDGDDETSTPSTAPCGVMLALGLGGVAGGGCGDGGGPGPSGEYMASSRPAPFAGLATAKIEVALVPMYEVEM